MSPACPVEQPPTFKPRLTHHAIAGEGAVNLAVAVGKELMARVVGLLSVVGGSRKMNVCFLRPSQNILIEDIRDREGHTLELHILSQPPVLVDWIPRPPNLKINLLHCRVRGN